LVPAASAGCAACGSCCDPVVLKADVYTGCCERARAGDVVHDNDRFIAQHWHPQGAIVLDAETLLELRCDAFDPATRLCTAREDRPPVCRDYPWYGEDPVTSGRGPRLYPDCSYLADVPPDQRPEGARPLIPLTVISH
jgi:Fe-S-cluster containining protein